MKNRSLSTALLLAAYATSGLAQSPTAQLPYDDGLSLDYPSASCGVVVLASNGAFKTGFAWQYDGVGSSGVGAFAARIQPPWPGTVCAVSVDFTQTGNDSGQLIDVFVWEDEGPEGDTRPGAVLAMTLGVDVGTAAYWPEVSKHFVAIDGPCVEGPFWAGFVGNWAGEEAPFYVAADLEMGAGESRTFVGPGLGYPSGWQSIDTIWEPIGALGIGANIYGEDCTVNPVIDQSWGAIRARFR